MCAVVCCWRDSLFPLASRCWLSYSNEHLFEQSRQSNLYRKKLLNDKLNFYVCQMKRIYTYYNNTVVVQSCILCISNSPRPPTHNTRDRELLLQHSTAHLNNLNFLQNKAKKKTTDVYREIFTQNNLNYYILKYVPQYIGSVCLKMEKYRYINTRNIKELVGITFFGKFWPSVFVLISFTLGYTSTLLQ